MVINEYVEVTGNPKNYKRYIELGYDIKINEKILIKEKDLSNSSTIIVERKCDCCGEIFSGPYRKVISSKNAYGGDYCSKCKKENKFIKDIKIKKQSESYKKRTGYEFSFLNPEIREKNKKYLLENYNVENVMQIDSVKKKVKETMLKKYGVENASQNDDIKQKKIETCLKNFGTEYPAQNKQVLKKRKETCLKKYGVSFPSQKEEVKEKRKETCLQKYGVEYPTQNKDIVLKTKNTNIKKYGVTHPMKNLEIKEKMMSSFQKNGEIKTSSQQEACFNILKKEGYDVKLNFLIDGFALDILLEKDGQKIDIEYDGNYWHQDKNKDRRRDEVIKSKGFKIFRIKSDRSVPTIEQLKENIDLLINNNRTFISIEI